MNSKKTREQTNRRELNEMRKLIQEPAKNKIRIFVITPDNLSLITATYMVEKEK